jgi:hypothetical protein
MVFLMGTQFHNLDLISNRFLGIEIGIVKVSNCATLDKTIMGQIPITLMKTKY